MGVSWNALDWFSSYFSDRCLDVSLHVWKCCSVLWCSSWILFICICYPLGHFISKFKGIYYHYYADDIQLYVSDWMANNLLQLNTEKTEVLLCFIASKVAQCIGSLCPDVKFSLRNLGFDQCMCFKQHIKSLTRSCYFHLRNTTKLRALVSRPELQMIIHAFMCSLLPQQVVSGLSTNHPGCYCKAVD